MSWDKLLFELASVSDFVPSHKLNALELRVKRLLSDSVSVTIPTRIVFALQVSEYLKKQMIAADGDNQSEDIKNMLADNDKLVEEIFQHEDKDKNGFISHEEFSGPKHDEL